MSSSSVIENANFLAPLLNGVASPNAKNRIAAIASTTSSAIKDLSTVLTDVGKGHFIAIQADGADIYVAFNNANSGSIDQAAVDGTNVAQQCVKITNGTTARFRIVKGFHFLVHKAASAATLRVWLSSYQDQDQVA